MILLEGHSLPTTRSIHSFLPVDRPAGHFVVGGAEPGQACPTTPEAGLITLFGAGDLKPLAGGISEALITTLFGLVVAIPALLVHAYLARRSHGIVQTTERLGLAFVNGLRSKTIKEQP